MNSEQDVVRELILKLASTLAEEQPKMGVVMDALLNMLASAAVTMKIDPDEVAAEYRLAHALIESELPAMKDH